MTLDQVFAELREASGAGTPGLRPGYSITVTHGDRVLWSEHKGLARLEDGTPISPRSRIHGASLAKQFTALAVLQLRNEGRLTIDDPLNLYMPELAFGTKVTLHHLLTHTSGIRDQWPLMEMAGWRDNDLIETHDVLNIIGMQPAPQFEPGSRYMYSNTGYTILAEIVSRLAGVPFAEFVRREIFARIGMTESLIATDPSAIIARRADAYRVEHKAPTPRYVRYSPNLYVAGSTSLLTTPRDYSYWMRAHAPSSPWRALIDELRQPRVVTGDSRFSYGYGYFSERTAEGTYSFHGGEDFGFACLLLLAPDADSAVAIFANTPLSGMRRLAKAALRQVTARIASTALTRSSEDSRLPKQGALSERPTLAAYTGWYVSPFDELRSVQVRDGRLVASWGGETYLHQVDIDTFTTSGGECYAFQRNDEKVVDSVVHTSLHETGRWLRLQPVSEQNLGATEACPPGTYFSPQTCSVITILEVSPGELSLSLPKQSPRRVERVSLDLYAAGDYWFRFDGSSAAQVVRLSAPRCLNVEFQRIWPRT